MRAPEVSVPRRALVTGGSGALGAAVAQRLDSMGFRVLVHYFENAERAREVAAKLDNGAAVQADLTCWDDVTNLEETASTMLDGSIGVLVNCSGLRIDGLMATQSVRDWKRVIDINLLGTFHSCRAFLPRMLRERVGRIVNVVSPAAVVGSPGQTAYSAAKAGVIGMTRSLAHECGRRGVTVNCLSPGYMDTAMTASIPPSVREALLGRAAVSTSVEPDEVAAAVELIVEAPHLTGHVLAVDGGLGS